jgi:hypothetical protein
LFSGHSISCFKEEEGNREVVRKGKKMKEDSCRMTVQFVSHLFHFCEAFNLGFMGLFIQTSNDKLVWISILRVKSCGVFSTMVTAVDDCEEFCLTKSERVLDFDMEQVEEGILVGVVLLDTPNCSSQIILELHDLADIGAFAHFLVGGDGHGSELPLDGR